MNMARLTLMGAAPLLLVSCLLTPGKFVSTLDIRKDRSFTFTYAGEVIAAEERTSESTDCEPGEDGCDAKAVAERKARKAAEQEAKLRDVAEALRREQGYRSVEYLGRRRFRVDYALSGRLDRNFVYPFNSDAAAVFPWVVVELRKDGTARMKAPGLGDEEEASASSPAGPLGESGSERDGTFTFTTDAELVMQNEESGPQPGPGGAKRVVWRVTPASKAVPTAVVRFPG
jgi:hypothetical protein